MNFKLAGLDAYLVLIIWLGPAFGLLAEAAGEFKLPHKIELARGSFMLIAQVSVVQHNFTAAYYGVEELHSSWQARSRLNYELDEQHGSNGLLGLRGTIYATESETFVLRKDDGKPPSDCKRAGHRQLNEALNLHFLAKEENLGIAIGIARLLLFIERHSSKFEPAPLNSAPSLFQANLDGDLTITLNYDKTGSSLPLGVPQRVLVELGLQFKMLVKFLRAAPLMAPLGELIPSDSSMPSVRQAHTSDYGGNLLSFDMFAIERARGCSIDRPPQVVLVTNTSRGDDFLQALAAGSGRFSFEARLGAVKLNKPLTARIDYEPSLASLRVERLMASRMTSTLVNYNVNRIFHVIRRKGANDTVLDKILKVNQNNNGAYKDRSCVVLQAAASEATGSAKTRTIGKLLMGITDTTTAQITYLGLARVRGIEAHAYEAHGTQLPAWFEQPSVYLNCLHKAGEEVSLRMGAILESARSESNLTSVFYFSRSADSNNRLLLMEVFAKNASDKPSGRPTLSIPIYNFSWRLQTTAPGGQRVEDFFSLGDECLLEHSYHARINLKLKRRVTQQSAAQVPPTGNWLRLRVWRNLALLQALHEQFEVPSTLMYDFESKYDESSDSNSSIAITMLMTQHLNQPIQLVYLGKAMLRRFVAAQFYPFWVLNFQVCYLVASHKQEDTLFAYNPVASNCYTLSTRMESDEPAEHYFHFGSEFLLETYKIVHPHKDRTRTTNMDSLHRRLHRSSRVILTTPGRDIPHVDTHQVAMVEYAIANVAIENRLDSGERVVASGTFDRNLFRGLGLVVGESPTNELVSTSWNLRESTPLDANTVISFVQCQQACLLSTQCRAFSTCIVQGRLECVLTSANFRAPELSAKLVQLQSDKRGVRLGQVFQVNASVSGNCPTTSQLRHQGLYLPAQTIVHLTRHPTCELHNKHYSQLFTSEPGGPTLVSLTDTRLLIPATRPESCAELCFWATVDAIRPPPEGWWWWWWWAKNLTNSRGAHLCSGYFFLDRQLVETGVLATAIPSGQLEVVVKPAEAHSSTAYCLLDSDLAGQANESDKPLHLVVMRHHRFELNYIIFYERSYGRYLIESRMTQGERDAYDKIMISGGREDNDESGVIMRAFVERGGNTGNWMMASSAAECARLCFTQAALVWPACRSFEFIEVITRGGRTPPSQSLFCAFNGVTMRKLLDLGRDDMIWHQGQPPIKRGPELDREDEFQVWHYEPKRGGLLGDQDQNKPHLRWAAIRPRTTQPFTNSSRHRNFKTISLCVIVYLLAMLGFMVGTRLGASRLTLNELLSRLGVMHGSPRGARDQDRLVGEHAPADTELDDIGRAQPAGPS